MNKQILLTIIVSSLSVLFNALCAQNIPTVNITGPDNIQVNSYTGNMFYQRTDLSIQGQGLPLEIKFSYNSGNTAINNGYGSGWTHNYNMRYEANGTGITIRREDGRQDNFTLNGTTYQAPIGVFDVLEQYQPDKYRLTTKYGISYFFDDPAHKKLTKIEDRNSNTINITYTGDNPVTITDATGRNLSLTWNNGQLTKITDANIAPSRTVSYQYDTDGNLIQSTDPLGNTTNYVCDTCRKIVQITDKNGNDFNIGYNTNGAVATISSPFTNQSIVYDIANNKTINTEQVGTAAQATTYTYDNKGRLINIQGNCCGNNVTYGYDTLNNITQFTDANGNSSSFTYDRRGNLLTETGPLGDTKTYTYEPNFNFLAGVTDKRGSITTYNYDAKGNRIQVNKPLGIVETYTYDNTGNRTGFTDGNGNTTTYTYTYNTNSTFITINYPIGSVNYTMDNSGNILTETDANGNTTAYTYDASNRLLTVTDPLSNITQYTYDNNGNRTSVADVNGNTTTYTFDVLNRLTSEINPLGETFSYTYDAAGNQTGITGPNGNVATKTYDGRNNPISVTDLLGIVSTSTYDNNSNMLTQTDANGNTVSYTYDALNRRTTLTDASGNTTIRIYDKNANLTSEQDRNGNTTTYTYDPLNRLTATTYANGSTVTFNYDAVGNKTTATDAKGNTTAYAYDANNRLTQITYADGTTKAYTYDAHGNMLTSKDNNGNITRYTYDQNYRLIKRTYPKGNDKFTYDAVGKTLTVRNKNAKITYTYDNAGRLLSETLNKKTTQYAYDITGRTRTVTSPNRRAITEHTNPRNILSSIKEGNTTLVDLTYDAGNRLTQRNYANGTAAHFTYDQKNLITGISHEKAGSSFAQFNYGYDAEGNALFAEKVHHNTNSEVYAYDVINQLSNYKEGTLASPAIPLPLTQTQYNYDAAGNRTTTNTDSNVVTYTSNNVNEYTNITGSELTYDANGNLINDGTLKYKYDFENRLIEVKTVKKKGKGKKKPKEKKLKVKIKYDALGRRIEKKTKIKKGCKTKTKYYFDEMRVIEESNKSKKKKKLSTTYVYGTGIDEALSMTRNGVVCYYHENALGSVVAVTDNAGDLAERYEYDAYGKVSIYDADYNPRTASEIGNTYLFTGREYEQETGLYYYRARHYNPETGRFLQRDPIGIWEDEENLGNGYSYVGNNPIIRTDPTGLYKIMIHGNWCGPGNRGGPDAPAVDEYDVCCYYHDKCWDRRDQGHWGWLDDSDACNHNLFACWDNVTENGYALGFVVRRIEPSLILSPFELYKSSLTNIRINLFTNTNRISRCN